MLDNTIPLNGSRGNRLPLYLWPAMDAGQLTQAEAEELVSELDKRGIGLVCSWSMDDTSKVLAQCLPVARARNNHDPVRIIAGTKTISIKYEPGECKVIAVK